MPLKFRIEFTPPALPEPVLASLPLKMKLPGPERVSVPPVPDAPAPIRPAVTVPLKVSPSLATLETTVAEVLRLPCRLIRLTLAAIVLFPPMFATAPPKPPVVPMPAMFSVPLTFAALDVPMPRRSSSPPVAVL